MRKFIFAALMGAACILPMNAQDVTENPIEKKVKYLDEKLDLNEEQEKQVQAIFSEYENKNESTPEEQKACMEEMNGKIKSLLSDAQKVKFEEMIQEKENI